MVVAHAISPFGGIVIRDQHVQKCPQGGFAFYAPRTVFPSMFLGSTETAPRDSRLRIIADRTIDPTDLSADVRCVRSAAL